LYYLLSIGWEGAVGNTSTDAITATFEAEPVGAVSSDEAVECTAIVAVSDVRDTSDVAASSITKTGKMSIWLDIESEQVCKMYTHLPKPVYKSNYNGYKCSGSAYSSVYDRYNSDVYDKNASGTPVANGAVGLRNLGNTCYMNSKNIINYFNHFNYISIYY
jgi:hypothetical protein